MAVVGALALLWLAGCAGSGLDPVPARLVDPTEASRAELRRIVSDALGGAELTISQDALTRDSLLIIERRVHRDLEHGRVVGRDPGRPEQFRLLRDPRGCLLEHLTTGTRWRLEHATCTPT